jgi:amino acid adenylation domain-containing protein
MEQMQPGTAAYILSMAQHLRGPLDTDALRVALDALVARHDILRSVYPLVDGAPVQRVMPRCDADFSVVNLADTPGDARNAEMRHRVAADFAQPFDLASDRLLRARVYVLDGDSHVFVLTAHHMIADGWSVALIGRELAAFYGAAAEGKPLPAAGPVAQYASYAKWQRDALASNALAADLKYWTERLSDVPRVLALPTDRTRPAVPSYRGERLEFQVDAALTSRLRQLSRSAGASLYMLLLAAKGLLLARHARQPVVVIGTPIAGRSRDEWSSIIGCFVNTLAISVDVSGDPTFADLLGRVRETSLGAFDHQDLPFEHIVAALQPERDLSRNPVVQVSVGLHNAPGQTPLATLPLPGLHATPIDIDAGTVRFDLELDVWEVPDGLHGRLLYAADLFDASTAARLVSQFRVLLGGIAADPQCRVSRLALVTDDEQRAMTTRWNPPAALPRRGRLLHELVREQAARTPSAVAVVCGDRALCYAELMTRSRVLAHTLRRAGVAPDEPVALCAARGTPAVIAMLGILESGAAYVPVDPEHPPARAAQVLEDSGARIIVAESAFEDRFAGRGLQIVRVGLDEGEAAPPSGQDADEPIITPESLAYVMYTSGSTGRPKGVAVPHRAVVGLLDAMHRVLPLAPGDVFLAVTTFIFDISVLEIFLPLTRGARLVIAEREDTLDGARLAAAIAARRVSAMQATPATWSLLIESGWKGAPAMCALCGGEALPQTLATALTSRCARAWNVYGPTETTIWSSVDEVRAGAPVTIGYPLANNELHVLDEHLEQQPAGMIGEIWIGGEGVARGYFGRPDLTAAAFRPDPFAPRAGARMYRTGDLGRRRDDGRIECLGRIDQQVKFRGFRIEPGDIEATLLTHESIAQAVVTLAGIAASEQRLVAYVVARPGRTVTIADLRRHVQDRLPAYLVPTHFVVLDALPSTPNGKINRAALPAPSPVAPAGVVSEPVTELERTLANIWAAVLRVERVGRDDSFFDLGGHSLLLAKVRAQIAARLGRDVAVLDLFRFPTIAALARHLTGAAAVPSGNASAASVARQAAALGRFAQAAADMRGRNV